MEGMLMKKIAVLRGGVTLRGYVILRGYVMRGWGLGKLHALFLTWKVRWKLEGVLMLVSVRGVNIRDEQGGSVIQLYSEQGYTYTLTHLYTYTVACVISYLESALEVGGGDHHVDGFG